TLLVFILVSACSRPTKFQRVLTDTSHNSYWISKKINPNAEYKDQFDRFQFTSNGKCNIYHSTSENEKGSQWKFIEGKSDDYWSFNEKDSVLKIDRLIYRVVRFSKDSIIMEGKGYQGKFALINSKSATFRK
ncbi:MAG: hypothetical protein ACXVB0_22955, partial [Mucilaginibacter sp.]